MKQIKNSMLLLLAAFIWGTAFVAQSAGMDYVGGFTFSCVRSLIGSAVLFPCIFLMKKLRESEQGAAAGTRENAEAIIADMRQNAEAIIADTWENAATGTVGEQGETFWQRNRILIKGGVCCGVPLTIATNLQQHGIKYTSVGKAGFITALYIVLVPIFGIFLHKKVGKFVWLGLALAVPGLYFLCMNEKVSMVGAGDLLLLFCAAVFALQILAVDHFAPLVDGVALSCAQFFTCGVLSAIPMLLFEEVRWENLMGAAIPILYAGVLSCGVAYTLQIFGQKNMNPTVASMLMSLESVFSVLAGLVVLGQRLSGRELSGCCLMFAAVILSQLPEKKMAEK